MRIFGIMLVKNEADIVHFTLEAAKSWADKVFILDNGSDDGTWEIVNDMADGQIVPWKQDFRVYSNALRADVFNAFRNEAQDGDWWCYKMDSDEFYVDDPVSFLSQVPRKHHVVYKRSIDYMITHEDVRELTFTGDFAEDRENIRYFVPRAYSEPRFFRHRRRLRWPDTAKSPRHMGLPHPKPITVQHYQWRSPKQMQQRIDARMMIPRDARGKPFRHVRQKHWEEALMKREDLVFDDKMVDLRSIPVRRDIARNGVEYVIRRFLHGSGILP